MKKYLGIILVCSFLILNNFSVASSNPQELSIEELQTTVEKQLGYIILSSWYDLDRRQALEKLLLISPKILKDRAFKYISIGNEFVPLRSLGYAWDYHKLKVEIDGRDTEEAILSHLNNQYSKNSSNYRSFPSYKEEWFLRKAGYQIGFITVSGCLNKLMKIATRIPKDKDIISINGRNYNYFDNYTLDINCHDSPEEILTTISGLKDSMNPRMNYYLWDRINDLSSKYVNGLPLFPEAPYLGDFEPVVTEPRL
ncbi:MAG: hypothetical protein HON90_06545 [Halobacteriovoraceae bacterium]|nr:hypothetical protein [Halobacteriovoraceae bacterium]